MTNLNFMIFCLTVIALVAIATHNDKIALQAVMGLKTVAKDLTSALGKLLIKGKVPSESPSDNSEA